jgi:mono/diheme cytochrome c family protein
MTIMPRKKSPVTQTLFVTLLLVAAGSGVYAFFHPGPWIVPEAAKRVANPLKPSQVDLPATHKLYLDKCADCHGEAGKGDGPKGRMYEPLPTDLTDVAHMNAVSDGELFYKISQGRRPMPAFKKRLTDKQRWELVLFLRSLSAAPSRSGASGNNDKAK